MVIKTIIQRLIDEWFDLDGCLFYEYGSRLPRTTLRDLCAK